MTTPTNPKIERWVLKPSRAAVVMTGLMLAGCSSPWVVQNPRTGETVLCGDGASEWNPWSQHDACVADHVAQGWIVTRAP
jgi:hypothetical protein